jgi:hypothetical protein
MPDKTDILVHGVAEDDQLLKELIQDSRNHCFVVYPSEDAVPLTALFPATGPTGATGESSAQVAEIVPVAVLIDGTWNQAQRMHKHFEAMQHVVVFPTGPVEFRIPRWLETNRTTALLVLCTGNLETQKKLYPDIFIFSIIVSSFLYSILFAIQVSPNSIGVVNLKRVASVPWKRLLWSWRNWVKAETAMLCGTPWQF